MSIRKLKSKKYGYTYQVDVRYKDPFGVTQRHTKGGFRTKREAKNYEANIIEKSNAYMLIPQSSKKTLNDVYEEYIEVEGQIKWAPATLHYYNQTHSMYVKDDFGKVPIESVNYVSLQSHINELSQKYNYPTVKNIKKIYSVIFKHGVRAGYISTNPVPNILLSNIPEKKTYVEVISDKDLKRLIEEIINPSPNRCFAKKAQYKYRSYGIALLIGRYTGLRISEVMALKKEDFDLERNQLTIRRKVEYIGLKRKEIYLTERLKTKSSKAKVEICSILSEYLKSWFVENPYEFVICDEHGDFITPSNFQERIRDTAKKLDIKFHYHMLRHTYATELMMSGINPIIVRDLLRHSTVNTTWNVYTHPSRDDQRKALDDLYDDNIEFINDQNRIKF
ncbi:site-specific integrase [Thomasclavelia cocleata]|jgi:integrase|uniref:site-specific integrase n=1 Tax=Thomasclavelia cocleata TaxID=69824 RepID=UPI00256FDB92|nr:site-specific integrase [Thomasclavelia cocleata]